MARTVLPVKAFARLPALPNTPFSYREWRENTTDWALQQFQTRCPSPLGPHTSPLTKWDIFHYVYAVLHHPQYRERYAANLRRDHRAPLYQLLAVFDGRAWLQLSITERTLYAAMLSREVNPLRLAYLEEAKALVKANRTIPKENIERLRRLGLPESELRGERILRRPNNGVDAVLLSAVPELRHPDDWRKGCSVIAVTVDFAHYDDDDLAEAFAKLIKTARPPKFAIPKRTSVFARKAGKKLKDWRTALVRLGIMRALHTYTFADCRFPKPFKQRGEKACYFARKAALRTFHSLFPSLLREKPIHWLTKGKRSR